MGQMKSKYGERQFLFQLHNILEKAERIGDNGEFVLLPAELVKDINNRLLMVVNRLDGPLFDEDENDNN
jgi:hypothetical protein